MKTIYCLLILHFINLQFINAMDTKGGGAGGSGQLPPGGNGQQPSSGSGKRGRGRPRARLPSGDGQPSQPSSGSGQQPSRGSGLRPSGSVKRVVGVPRTTPSMQISRMRIMSAGAQPAGQNPQNVQPTTNPANELFNSSNAPILHCGAFRESPIENTLLCNDCEEPVTISVSEDRERGWVDNLHNHMRRNHKRIRYETYQKKVNEYNDLNSSIGNYFHQEANDDEDTYRCNQCLPEKNIIKAKNGRKSTLGKHLSRHIKQWTEHRSSVAVATEIYLGPRAATSRLLQELKNEVATLRSQQILGGSSKAAYGNKRKYSKRENQPSGSGSVNQQIARSQQIIPDLNVAIEEPMEEIEHLMMPSALQRDQQRAQQIPVTEQMMQQLHVTQPQHQQHGQLIEQSMAQRMASSRGQQMQLPPTMSPRPSGSISGLLNRMATHAERSSQINKGKGIAMDQTPTQTQQRSIVGGLMPDARRTGTIPSMGHPPISRRQFTQQGTTHPEQMITFPTGSGHAPAPLRSVSRTMQHRLAYGASAGGILNAPQDTSYNIGLTQQGTQHSAAVRPSSQLAAGRSQFVSVASGYRQGTFGDARGTGAAQQSHRSSGEERPSGSGAQPNPSQNPTNYE